jgi:ABC-type oligopeptide transport system substrate-binding subunit
MKTKTIFLALLCGASMLALTGCSGGDKIEEAPKSTAASEKFQAGDPQAPSKTGPAGASSDISIGQ